MRGGRGKNWRVRLELGSLDQFADWCIKPVYVKSNVSSSLILSSSFHRLETCLKPKTNIRDARNTED